MNIFVLDESPKKAAKYHCDKHVVKMILETAQMLCTAHWESGGSAPYRPTHKNHPCTKWARETKENYKWLCQLGLELCGEYTNRYSRTHKTQEHIEWLNKNIPDIPTGNITNKPQAMPDIYKNNNVVKAYRDYYMGEKAKIAVWKYCNVPDWYNLNKNVN